MSRETRASGTVTASDQKAERSEESLPSALPKTASVADCYDSLRKLFENIRFDGGKVLGQLFAENSESSAAWLVEKFGYESLIRINNLVDEILLLNIIEPYRPYVEEARRGYTERLNHFCESLSHLRWAYIEARTNSAKLSVKERWKRLASFAIKYSGEGVQQYGEILFPELSDRPEPQEPLSEFPRAAPAIWKADKQLNETPPEFIRRVYGEWMGKGLTLAHVRRLDEPLAQSYYYHVRRGRPVPEGFDLPTKPQQIDRELERLEAGGVLDEFTAREARRLSSALGRRGK